MNYLENQASKLRKDVPTLSEGFWLPYNLIVVSGKVQVPQIDYHTEDEYEVFFHFDLRKGDVVGGIQVSDELAQTLQFLAECEMKALNK